MTSIDLSSLQFAGYVMTASRELRKTNRRVPRFVTAHRFLMENCVYSHEINEPGHWDRFRLDRSLKELIPEKMRNSALQAVSELASDSSKFGQPNICTSRDALRELLAASRVPRDAIQIIELGMRPSDAELVMGREDGFARLSGDKDPPHGIVAALRLRTHMSSAGSVLGVEPWYVDRRLRQSWRERHDSKAVRNRAFSRLNEHGLLNDFIDFDLFIPGLTPRRVHNREAIWVPLVLSHHSVESIIGDVRPRAARSAR